MFSHLQAELDLLSFTVFTHGISGTSNSTRLNPGESANPAVLKHMAEGGNLDHKSHSHSVQPWVHEHIRKRRSGAPEGLWKAFALVSVRLEQQ